MTTTDERRGLDTFSEPARAWFENTFAEPTQAQMRGWPSIASGDHTLISAPTGSGKTLAAFLYGLDRVANDEVPPDPLRTRVLYVSPLRALAVDVEKNLRAPLTGMMLAAERLGRDLHEPTVGTRTGDTPANERRRLVRHPPDVLITTPESLYLMLTSKARETLTSVRWVIIDEIHAMAGTKRGAHLSVSLERLEELTDGSPRRIGLSATQRPLSEIGRFLGGSDEGGQRPVTIVDAGSTKELDVEIVVPIEDMGRLGEEEPHPEYDANGSGIAHRSIWPSIHPQLLDLIVSHTSTLVFVNSRRLAERLATRLNELAAEGTNLADEQHGTPPDVELVRAHHGSLSRERRLEIEDALKSGRLKGLIATSSLELGIDMGAVDLVLQVESPGAVSRGMQRIGRAGHQVGEPSRGKVFPKHRNDLVEAAVVVRRMRDGLIEQTRLPQNPLDVAAQQIVAMCALDDWEVGDLAALLRRSANFSELSDDVLESVLDLLSGKYPSNEFAELRPRIVWDRVSGMVRARSGAQRLAVTNAGTIPDRGLFGVFLPDGTRVGELDEEMVYESRPGETFLLGASTWRIEDITFERVVVTPAPGRPGKMPFWHGDGPGRPLELGEAVGAFVRETRADPSIERLRSEHGLDELAARNVVQYLDDQADATGVVPDDRTIVVERFRDEIGDWRVCVLTPFGAQVHAPWAMALRSRLSDRWGDDPEMIWSDDGIVLRLPEAVDELDVDTLVFDSSAIEEAVVAQLPSSAMFAARFRECAGRALLLPRRRPDQRTPLWQQRQRAADLLSVAAKYPTFPMLLEATRECLNDVFDLAALRRIMTGIARRDIRVVPVETQHASPFAQSLLFSWIAVYMYEGDAPLAERRAAALALDRDLLRDLLGAEELRELIAPGVLADLELELQRIDDRFAPRDADEIHDLLRIVGPLSRAEIGVRAPDYDRWLDALVRERRVIEVNIAGETRLAVAEDAGRLRDALGVALPVGLPAALTASIERPLDSLVERYARTHGPFVADEVSAHFALPIDRVEPVLEALAEQGRIVQGEFRPGGVSREWCDVDVLRQLRRRSLAALRQEIEPVEQVAVALMLPGWQGVGSARRGADGVVDAVSVLQGAPIAASILDRDVLAMRVRDYNPSDLDALCTSGEIVWCGAGAIGSRDGRVCLAFRDDAADLFPPVIEPVEGAHHDAIRKALDRLGACFWTDLVEAVADADLPYDDETVLAALWDLVWSGEVTNDSLLPVRALAEAGRRPASRGRRRAPSLRRAGPAAGAGRWSLVDSLRRPDRSPTERAHARALQLLERYGVLTREAALGEGAAGGFAGVYPVLKALEERGSVRRGYFVAGLGAAQFAIAGAVDRLRAQELDGEERLLLATADPAQPYGAALRWPPSAGRPSRSAGAHLVLRGGVPVLFVERGGRSLATFEGVEADSADIAMLTEIPRRTGARSMEIRTVDGEPVADSPLAEFLAEHGFRPAYRGLRLNSSE